MIADWIRETTTGGAGALTTSAVTNRRRFTDAFAVGQPFFYAALSPAGDPIERGVAQMTAVGSMTRTRVFGYASGGSFTDANTAQNLPSGTVLVCADLAEGAGVQSFPDYHPSASLKLSIPYPYQPSANGAALGQRIVFLAIRVSSQKPVSAFAIEVITAAGGASDIMRVGLYGIAQNGTVGSLVCQSGDMLPNTTGLKTASVVGGPRLVPPGWYYLAMAATPRSNPASYQDVGVRAVNTGFLSEVGPLGIASSWVPHCFVESTELSYPWTALPLTPPAIAGIATLNATFCPIAHLIY